MKLLTVTFLISILYIFSFLDKKVIIEFNDDIFYTNQYFDVLDVNIINYTYKMNIVIEGLDLIGFNEKEIDENKGILKEIGIYNLVYKVYLNDNLLCLEYRKIVIYPYTGNTNSLVVNGDFSSYLYKWNITDNTNDLSYDIKDNNLIINQESCGDYFWDQCLFQFIHLEYNKKYKLNFNIYSNLNKQIEVSIYQPLHDSPWSYNYGLLEYVEINSENSLYSLEFDFQKPDEIEGFKVDSNYVKLEFKFGYNEYLNNINSTIYFSDIQLIEITS